VLFVFPARWMSELFVQKEARDILYETLP